MAPPLRECLRALVAGKTPWPLFLYGPAGTGKTCAALWLLDHAGGVYYAVPELCRILDLARQDRYVERGKVDGVTQTFQLSPEHLWTRLRAAPLVVLDEIGLRQEVSSHHYETVKGVLDARHNRPLVLISNLSLSQLSGPRLFDDRVLSRMGAGTLMKLDGADRRRPLPRS